MPRPEKVQAVAEIRERLEGAEAVFLTEYRGIAVKQMGDLRRRLREAGAEYKVVKMSLARLAADDMGLSEVGDHLVGPTALAFAQDDPVAAAKALRDYAKDDANLVIKLGLLAGKVLQPEEVVRLADIEPREVLLAKIAGAAKSPLAAMAGMLASFTRDAAGLFSALLDKRESEPHEAADTETTDEVAEEPAAAETAEDSGEDTATAEETTAETDDDSDDEDFPAAGEASAEDEPTDQPVESSDEEEPTAEAEEE